MKSKQTMGPGFTLYAASRPTRWSIAAAAVSLLRLETVAATAACSFLVWMLL